MHCDLLFILRVVGVEVYILFFLAVERGNLKKQMVLLIKTARPTIIT